MKIKDIHYSRTFAGNNSRPRETIGQYENERIGITVETTGTDNLKGLFEQAMDTVHKLQDEATQFRVRQREIKRMEQREIKRMESELEDIREELKGWKKR